MRRAVGRWPDYTFSILDFTLQSYHVYDLQFKLPFSRGQTLSANDSTRAGEARCGLKSWKGREGRLKIETAALQTFRQVDRSLPCCFAKQQKNMTMTNDQQLHLPGAAARQNSAKTFGPCTTIQKDEKGQIERSSEGIGYSATQKTRFRLSLQGQPPRRACHTHVLPRFQRLMALVRSIGKSALSAHSGRVGPPLKAPSKNR